MDQRRLLAGYPSGSGDGPQRAGDSAEMRGGQLLLDTMGAHRRGRTRLGFTVMSILVVSVVRGTVFASDTPEFAPNAWPTIAILAPLSAAALLVLYLLLIIQSRARTDEVALGFFVVVYVALTSNEPLQSIAGLVPVAALVFSRRRLSSSVKEVEGAAIIALAMVLGASLIFSRAFDWTYRGDRMQGILG